MDQDNDKPRKRRNKSLLLDVAKEFSSNTALHGMGYFSEDEFSIYEKLFWMLTILVSLVMCCILMYNVWNKWQTSPVIVSFSEKMIPVWQVPFPAVTICPQMKSRASVYNYTANFEEYMNEMMQNENLLPTTFRVKLNNLALVCEDDLNFSFVNRDICNDTTVSDINEVSPEIDDIFESCTWRGKPKECADIFSRVLTSKGVCYTFNGLKASEIFHEDRIQKNYQYINAKNETSGWSLENGYTTKDTNKYPLRGRENGAKPDLDIILKENITNRDSLCNGLNKGFKFFYLYSLYRSVEVFVQKSHYVSPSPDRQYETHQIAKRQCDVISPKLFTTALEDVFKLLDWTGYGINIYGEYITHLRFADDIVIMAESLEDLGIMLRNHIRVSQQVVHLHHPADAPRSTMYSYGVLRDQTMSLAVSFRMVTTSDRLKTYDPLIRQCYFPSDRELRYFKKYTQSNCEAECRTNYTLTKCGCVWFNMPHNDSNELCCHNMRDCVDEAKEEFADYEMKLAQEAAAGNVTDAGCRCLPACDSLHYDSDVHKTDFDLKSYYAFYKNMFNVSEEDTNQYSRLFVYFKEAQFVSITRSELFGVTDFLANCGGLLGLFLGFSFISLVEIAYFSSLRICCILHRDRNVSKNKRNVELAHLTRAN